MASGRTPCEYLESEDRLFMAKESEERRSIGAWNGGGFWCSKEIVICSAPYTYGPMRSYYVYILCCRDGSYYTGVTNDYEHRIGQHQRGNDPRAYTFTRRPVKLVYLSTFGDIREAIAWEKKLKRWSRRKKEALIMGDYDELPGLAECKNETHYRYFDSNE